MTRHIVRLAIVCALLAGASAQTPPNPRVTAADIATNCDAPTAYARMLFPGGLRRALTMSYDDGQVHDRRLVAIFNAHGIRGTFNLVSGTLDKEGYLTRAEVKSLFASHEVAAHTVTHPPLTKQTDEVITREVMDNRADLERLVGYPVRGLAYPGGDADQRVAEFLPKLGIAYARLVAGTTWMATPDRNPLAWNCTCHHNDCLKQVDRLLGWESYPALLSIWGHSYEFEEQGTWSMIEQFCARLGGRQDIWYATNIEVFDYLAAVRALRVSADGGLIANPSAIPVWIDFEGRAVELKPGVTTRVRA